MDYILLGFLLIAIPVLGHGDPWQNALFLFATVIASVFTVTYYDVLGKWLGDAVPAAESYAQVAALLGIFAICFALLVGTFWRPLPAWTKANQWHEVLARYGLAAVTSYMLVGVLMTAAYVGPMPDAIAPTKNPNSSSFIGLLSPHLDYVQFVDHLTTGSLQTYDNKDQRKIWSSPRYRTPKQFE